jgi:hypothetical protein
MLHSRPCTLLFLYSQLLPTESYATTNDQSARLSWNKAPIWGLRPELYYCQTVAGLLMLGALSDGRTGLWFRIAADPRQRSHSWVRVPWDSRQYFTVSNSRLPFSSPSMTPRATVEVFDSTSTRYTLPVSEFASLITTLHGPYTACIVYEACVPRCCLATDVLLLRVLYALTSNGLFTTNLSPGECLYRPVA